MERLSINPRRDWQAQVESLGLSFHTISSEPYWDESACYRFNAQEIAELAKATNEIETMCMAVVAEVIRQRRYRELDIPEHAWSLIESSWQRGDKAIYGRLDFSYDGTTPPKLLEYNADTPTSLLEASLIQSQWQQQVYAGAAQFNSIHQRLVAAWQNFGPGPIHLTCVADWREELDTLSYMAETIRQAGFTAKILAIDKISWNGQAFIGIEQDVINTLFKLYPWEHLIDEGYRAHADQATLQIIEPLWKMVLTNKGLMVLLWEMFPNHPNLLPTFFDTQHISGDYVRKPIYGRQGENVAIYSDEGNVINDGGYPGGVFIVQKLHPLANNEGNYAVIGSWLIAGESAGIGIRETGYAL